MISYVHRGICLTKTCNVSGEDSAHLINDAKLLKKVITECTNLKLQKLYDLEGNVSVRSCEHKGHIRTLDNNDWLFIAIILGILIMNAVGTTYHMWSMKSEIKNCTTLFLTRPNYLKFTIMPTKLQLFQLVDFLCHFLS
jgi:hypothetical protein